MEARKIEVTANCPNVEEFTIRFPQYGPFAKGDGKFLFETLTSVDSYLRMRIFTESDYPAVTGVAEISYQAVNQNSMDFTPYVKQFIGAVTCFMMESNGYEKSNKKKSIPHAHFTKGEVYRIPPKKLIAKSE